MILHGVDVHARYQPRFNIRDLPGCDFVITKCTGGTGLVIDGWEAMLDGAKLTGVYHYAREKGYQGSAKAEAAHFIGEARKAPADAMLVLDWEEAAGTNLGDTAWVLEWCQIVEKALGRKPVIYTGNSVLAQHYGWWAWSNEHDYYLWYARYPSKKPVGWQSYGLPTVPNWPDKKIAMWQYSSAGGVPGWPAALDLNIFYGDADQWRAIAGSKEASMAWDGKMASPVVSSRVSAEHRFNPTGSYAGHAGIDLVCPVGTPVYAAYGGVVELVGTNIVTGRTGRGVLIKNPDGERQYYGHLSEIQVVQGQKIAMGEQIALSGATGNVTGPHVHWETWNASWDDDRNPRVDFNAHGVIPGSTTGQITKTTPEPIPDISDPILEESTMLIIKAPARPAALVGPATFHVFRNSEEQEVVLKFLAPKVKDGLNDRQYDVLKSVILAGTIDSTSTARQLTELRTILDTPTA